MSHRLRLILALCLAAVPACGGWFWYRGARIEKLIQAGVPTHPAAGKLPRELGEQLRSAEGDHARSPRSIEPLGRLARLYHANGYTREALQAYTSLATLEPKEPRWAHGIANILGTDGRLEEALPWRRTVATLAPDYVAGQVLLAETLARTNHGQEADQRFAELASSHPEEPHGHLGLARSCVERQEWTQAQRYLNAAIAAQGDFAPALNLLVTVEERLGNALGAAEAQRAAKQAARYRGVNDPWADELLPYCFNVYQLAVAASALSNSGNPVQAEALLRRAMQLQPNDGKLYRQLGELLLKANRLVEAEQVLREGTRIMPDRPECWVGLALLLQQLGRSAEADRVVSDGLVQNADAYGLYLIRARRRVAAGKAEEALADFRKAGALQTDDPAPFVDEARLLFSLERIPEGIDALKGALKAEPDNPFALFLVTRHAIETHDEKTAREGLARARLQPRIKPSDLGALDRAFHATFPGNP